METMRQVRLWMSCVTVVVGCGLAGSAFAAAVGIDPPANGSTVTTTTLNVTTSFSKPSVNPPGTVNWSIIITNTGSVLAKDVSVSNLLPVDFRYAETGVETALASLGDIAPGLSVVKTIPITIPAGTAANRYVDEATISALNVDPQESDAAIDIITGQVLGAEDTTLAATGNAVWPILIIGILCFIAAGSVLRSQTGQT